MRCFQSPMAVDNNSLHHSLLLSLHQCPFCLKFPNVCPQLTTEIGGQTTHSITYFFLRSVSHLFDLSSPIGFPFFLECMPRLKQSPIGPALKYGAWKEKKGNPTKVEQIFRTRA